MQVSFNKGSHNVHRVREVAGKKAQAALLAARSGIQRGISRSTQSLAGIVRGARTAARILKDNKALSLALGAGVLAGGAGVLGLYGIAKALSLSVPMMVAMGNKGGGSGRLTLAIYEKVGLGRVSVFGNGLRVDVSDSAL